MTDLIRTETAGGIGHLVLNQPARRNAISSEMWSAIPPALHRMARDPDIRVLIVRGEGEHFAAGADISEFETVYATPESSETYSAAISQALETLSVFPKPVIAAIDGACVGGGVSIALACDLRVASQSAKFAITPGKLGLVYPFEDIRRLIAAVGEAEAKALLFSGELLSASRARDIGLINRLSEGSALPTALDLAASFTATSQWSLQATKDMFRLIANGDRAAGDRLFLSSFGGNDFKEGYRAFLEKRPAKFSWRS